MLVACAIYGWLGDPAEALALLAFVCLSVGLGLSQTWRAERALSALRRMAAVHCQVWRDGSWLRLSARELVVGDLLAVAEGDRVGADARLLQSADLVLDESMLTGESAPVQKQAMEQTHQPCADAAAAHLFGGSRVLAGQALARVEATGARSEVGRLGLMVESVAQRPSPIQAEVAQWVGRLSLWAAVLSGLLVLVLVGVRGQPWLVAALAGIALAMSLLPQELPLMLQVFYALGSRRLAEQKVLVRRPASVEALGSVSLLLTDKTGTLTRNEMVLACLSWPAQGPSGAIGTHQGQWWLGQAGGSVGEVSKLASGWVDLLTSARLASESQPRDPMERSLLTLCESLQAWLPAFQRSRRLLREFGLVAGAPVMCHVWVDEEAQPRDPSSGVSAWVASKGAPEAIARLCADSLPSDALETARKLAARGMRVLAVAGGRCSVDEARQAASPQGLRQAWLGVLAWADPLRPEVPAALSECRAAGVRVAMVTGDHPSTAWALAVESGLASGPQQVVTGPELDQLSDEGLRTQLKQCVVFARISPAQKLRLVAQAQAAGQVVAMTGDGVNDAPSLRAADVGIAMGERGTEVAREAADIVLLDDAFGSIVAGLRAGRHIRHNLQQALSFLVAAHVPIALLCLLPALLDKSPLLLPMHIVFLELLIAPMCSLAFEAAEDSPHLLSRGPRSPGELLMSRSMAWASVWQGLVVFGVVTGVDAWATGLELGRGPGFGALVGNLMVLALHRAAVSSSGEGTGRSRAVSPLMAGLAGLGLSAWALVWCWPMLRRVFELRSPSAAGVLAVVAAWGLVWLLVGVLAACPQKKKARPPKAGAGLCSQDESQVSKGVACDSTEQTLGAKEERHHPP
jgi:Ca2+-transporting ATPase